MKSTFRFFTLITCLFLTSFSFAQKYGHLNYGNLLQQVKEVKAADTQLETMQKQLTAKGEEMVKAFEGKYAMAMEELQAGKLSPLQQKEMEKELKGEQDAILKYEEEVKLKLFQKREELLQPILDKVNNAVKTVAEENGYAMVFDTSIFNALLFVQESDDLMPMVKAKLGI